MTPSTFLLRKQELSQLRQFATNFLRNRNNYGVTFAPNQTDWTSVLANDRQSGHKNSLRRPLLLKNTKKRLYYLFFPRAVPFLPFNNFGY